MALLVPLQVTLREKAQSIKKFKSIVVSNLAWQSIPGDRKPKSSQMTNILNSGFT